MEKISFIVQMPDEPGALHKAAKIAKKYQANIHRIHYNRKIDVNTVFFDITTSYEFYEKIKDELEEIGYLQTSIKPVSFLKFNVYLPHQAGALFEFLNYITSSHANIGFLDFDDETWSSVTITARGAMIYNSTQSNKSVAVLDFGGDKTSTAGDFTVIFPAATNTTAIIRIA